jgi:hypothetical protein
VRDFWGVYNILIEEIQLEQKDYLQAFYTLERAQTRHILIELMSREFAGPIEMSKGHFFTIMGVKPSPGTLDFSNMLQWIDAQPGTAIVKLFLGRQISAAWVITSSDEQQIQTVILPTLSVDTVSNLLAQKWFIPHQALDRAIKSREWEQLPELEEALKSSMDDLLQVLYQRIFLSSQDGESVLQLLRKVNASRVIIVPHGGLNNIPLHAAYHVQGEYLCDQFEVYYSPSVRLLNHVLKLERTWGDRILIVSNPDGTLKDTEKELEVLKPLFDSPIILGENQASPDNVLATLVHVQAVHFSCHATFNNESIGSTGLLLSDQKMLTVRDLLPDGQSFHRKLYNRQLRCVFLAACETALAESNPYNELLSLATGFMASGSPTVIASLWKVYHPAAIEFVQNFYTNIRKHKMATGTAFHEAQKQVRQNWTHPYYWAPFELIGSWHEQKSIQPAHNDRSSATDDYGEIGSHRSDLDQKMLEQSFIKMKENGITGVRVNLNLFGGVKPGQEQEALRAHAREVQKAQSIQAHESLIEMMVDACHGQRDALSKAEAKLAELSSSPDTKELAKSLRKILTGARYPKRLIELLERNEDVFIVKEILKRLEPGG